MKYLVGIPAYNEEKNIASIIAEVKKNLPHSLIAVLNDGSTDHTAEILKSIPDIIVIRHPFNEGIGAAVRTIFHYFLESDCDFLVRIDGDGQHPPQQADLLLEPLRKKEADIVIGSRFLEKRGYQSSKTRLGGIKLLNILSSLILKQKITDNTSGFRAYDRKAVAALHNDYPLDYPEPVEVYHLSRKGLVIKEVSVTMRERQGGLSSIGTLESYYYLVKVLLTILVHFLIGGKK
ncbi:MAG: glycosyltransferase family 2 protein [Candidatus Aminicenantes bacterium]|nr:glycosyltransferase family 2 protein [Candidatus Aminicenantes bacterium]